MPNILYGDKVNYKESIGIVKEVKGSFARVLLEGQKKTIVVPTDSLEKIND